MAYLYVTTARFNGSTAAAIRNLSFCEILKELGHEVIVISLDEIEREKIHVYEGIKYISLRSPSKTFKARACNFLFHKDRLKKCITKLSQTCKIEGLFFYDIPPASIFYLKKLAKIKRIKIFHDSVEWYSAKQFRWRYLALPFVLKNLLNKYYIDRQISVISVSKYLNNYFKSKGINSIRIPIIVDVKKFRHEKFTNPNKLELLYAGSPGRKDYLKEVVEGLSNLSNQELSKIELQILGVNMKQLVNICQVPKKIIEKCGTSLVVRGEVSRDEVISQLQKADFTILLRSPDLRYAKAGFPSKVVESLATSTPIICNITSDLGDYLKDAENCIIVESCTYKSFEIALRRALALSFKERQKLCSNARQTTERYFDYNKYIDVIGSYL